MDPRPTFQPQEASPQPKEFISEKEAKTFFGTISFSDFKEDFHAMVESSRLPKDRKEEVFVNLEKLYSRLEKGFALDTLKSQFIQTVSVDVSNGNEDELLRYFLFSMNILYEKFRRVHV